MTDPVQDYLRDVRERLDNYSVNAKRIGSYVILGPDLDKLLRALEVAMEGLLHFETAHYNDDGDPCIDTIAADAREQIARILRE